MKTLERTLVRTLFAALSIVARVARDSTVCSRRRAGRLFCFGCALWLLALPSPSLANDSWFGGDASALFPLEEARVRMLSEDIKLTVRRGTGFSWRWDVNALYVFENQSSNPVTLQVGFPELRCQGGGVKDEAHHPCTSGAMEDLTTLVDGKQVRHRAGSLSKQHAWSGYLGIVWLFDVTFPPRKKVRIAHSYNMGGTVDSVGNVSITYVTRTGAGWAGSIGRATFSARFPAYIHSIGKPLVKGLRTHRPRLRNPGEFEVVVEGTEWTPTTDVEFSFFYSTIKSADLQDGTSIWCRNRIESIPADEARTCINALYASKGYPFRSPGLRRQFYSRCTQSFVEYLDGNSWGRAYCPMAGFSPSWFTDDERQLLAALKRRVSGTTEPLVTEPLPEPTMPADSRAPVGEGVAPAESPANATSPTAPPEDSSSGTPTSAPDTSSVSVDPEAPACTAPASSSVAIDPEAPACTAPASSSVSMDAASLASAAPKPEPDSKDSTSLAAAAHPPRACGCRVVREPRPLWCSGLGLSVLCVIVGWRKRRARQRLAQRLLP